ncbi:MAG: ice-binding family protein [Candidatus Paceibacterota bacterium]
MPITALAAGPAPVDLGSAGNFTILAKSGISTTGTTNVVGDIGVSPASATYITGFALNLSAGSAFSTSALVTGKVYAPGYADPTPSNITTAVSDMETAYTNAQGRTNPTATELGAGNIGGLTLAPGLYKWGTNVTIPTDVTLSGGANDVWIFQIAQNLDISSATKIILSGGAQAGNVFWVVGGKTTIGTTATFNGNILDQTAIVLNTGAVLNGRALAQTAVTLDASSVNFPSVSYSAPVVVTPIVTPVSTNSSSNSGNNPSSSVSANSNNAQANIPSNNFGQKVKAIVVGLVKGSRGNNVKILQEFLISQNKGPAALALGKNGTTLFFGELTKKALAEFQASVGITPAGSFGPITRNYFRSNY